MTVMPNGSSSNEGPLRVLILGDGNFSFSLALCRLLWPKTLPATLSQTPQPEYINTHVARAYLGLPLDSKRQIQITTTSFDDLQELLKKYPETREILATLQDERHQAHGVRVMHGINAWELSSQFASEDKFDVVVWNHPHLGTEDFRLHRFLMAHFFSSVASVLNKSSDPCVCVSLVEGQETRWDLVAQAIRSDLQLKQVASFDERPWPGYVVKRNKHGGSFKNVHTKRHTGSTMKSNLFRFEFGEARVLWEGLDKTPIDRDLLPLPAPDENPEHTLESNRVHTTSPSEPSPSSQSTRHVHSITRSLEPADGLTGPTQKPVSTRKSRALSAIPTSLICPHCSKQLTSPRAWSQHVHMVHTLQKFGTDWTPARAKDFKCTAVGCEKSFAGQDALWQHEINKHTAITSEELPGAVDQLTGSNSGDATTTSGDDYDYIPCDVCGQAVVKRDWGMLLHLETLKPAVGLDMQCPLCEKDRKGAGKGGMGFIESRALFQHYKFCRTKKRDS
ncbi:hypothetical protein DFS34DRAFT_94739 [Phlyctochytrium arcticum]|nr:hypothetical protein DFS34DRAFT_94739 [Phlyctochytrium arcticum]